MNKITIFVGSNRSFEKIIPKSYRNLTETAMRMDDDKKKMELILNAPGFNKSEKEKKKKIRIYNMVIHADEYCSVQEHVLLNFANFLSKITVTNLFIQNPPLYLREQLYRVYGEKNLIEEIHQSYPSVSKQFLREFYNNYSERIVGQENVKIRLLQAIYPLLDDKQKKPAVILLYGESELGKTETAQYIAELLGGQLLRRQFSMYQNNEFANYLFGGKYYEKSFAQDLLARDSNVILLDEFDKAYSVFHSAFYQLFDEGIFEDRNHRVNVEYAIIICTSNYHSIQEVKECLGLPIYNRFDAIIEFQALSPNDKREIAKRVIEEWKEVYHIDDQEVFRRIIECSVQLCNAREIRKMVKDTFSLFSIRKICE